MINAKLPMLNKKRNIHERIYGFALGILDVIKLIPRSTENLILIKQLVRSATSIGANALEADGSETKKEFIHRFTIAKKEAKESLYWLSLISDHNPKIKHLFELHIKENEELVLIISKIIINTKKNSQ